MCVWGGAVKDFHTTRSRDVEKCAIRIGTLKGIVKYVRIIILFVRNVGPTTFLTSRELARLGQRSL